MLKAIILDAVRAWPLVTCEMTSMRRTVAENEKAGAKTTIHVTAKKRGKWVGWHRAADLRTKTFKDRVKETKRICDILNSKYVYDPKRPSMRVAIGNTHGSGPHIHLQVFPTTERRVVARSAQENGIWE